MSGNPRIRPPPAPAPTTSRISALILFITTTQDRTVSITGSSLIDSLLCLYLPYFSPTSICSGFLRVVDSEGFICLVFLWDLYNENSLQNPQTDRLISSGHIYIADDFSSLVKSGISLMKMVVRLCGVTNSRVSCHARVGASFSPPFITRPGEREPRRFRPSGNGHGVYTEGRGRDGLKPNKVPPVVYFAWYVRIKLSIVPVELRLIQVTVTIFST